MFIILIIICTHEPVHLAVLALKINEEILFLHLLAGRTLVRPFLVLSSCEF